MGKLSKSDEQKLEQVLINLYTLHWKMYEEYIGYGDVNKSESRDHDYFEFMTPLGDAFKFILRSLGTLGYGFYPFKGEMKLISSEEFEKIWMEKPEYQKRYNDIFGEM